MTIQLPLPHVVFFDLDHTLLPLDSDHAWGEFTSHIGWTDELVFRARNDEFFQQYRAGTLDINEYVAFATAAIVEKGKVQSQQAHIRFMQEVIVPAIRPAALGLLEKHRKLGHRIVLVTATNEFVVRPIAAVFGIPDEDVLAVQLKINTTTQWYTGEIDGIPSVRDGKVLRVKAWLASGSMGQMNLDLLSVETTFYTDSMNDLSLMQLVNNPVATNPDSKLKGTATENGWKILNLF